MIAENSKKDAQARGIIKATLFFWGAVFLCAGLYGVIQPEAAALFLNGQAETTRLIAMGFCAIGAFDIIIAKFFIRKDKAL